MAALTPLTWADATLRYHIDVQFANGTALAMPAYQDLTDNRDMVIRIKGNKTSADAGHLVLITDLKTQDLTTVDAMNKRYATVPLASTRIKPRSRCRQSRNKRALCSPR